MMEAPAHCPLRDRDVREALHVAVLSQHHDDPDTLVIEELGLDHGARRIDIAVVNGRLHGFEIKSDADTLCRLPTQAEAYGRVFDLVTLVVGERYAERVETDMPGWWGVLIATRGAEGGVQFIERRSPTPNPAAQPTSVAQLLWKAEVTEILAELGVPEKDLRKNRAALYRMLADRLEPEELGRRVRDHLKRREKWRGRRQP